MPKRLIFSLLLLCLTLCTAAAFAVPVEIQFKLQGEPLAQGSIPASVSASLATPGAPGTEDVLDNLRVTAMVPGTVRLDLAPGTAWRIEASAPGLWSPPQVVAPAPQGARAAVTLWPTAAVAGQIEAPRNEAPPEQITLRLQPSPETDEAALPTALFRCPVDEGRFQCEVPAARVDLRLRAADHISHFRWGVVLAAGERHDLGRFPLRRGASLIGWVEAEAEPVSARDCRVELLPMVAANASPKDRERRKGLTLSTQVSERGFFHFEGIAPGSYQVRAQQPGTAQARVFPITVLEDSETELRHPLVMEPPIEMQIAVSPARDSYDRPWKVQIAQTTDVPNGLMPVTEGTTAEDGVYREPGFSPGSYFVEIRNGDGARMATDRLELSRSSNRLDLELPLVWVEGTVRLGDEPLAAQLWFGGLGGAQRVTLQADENGEFSGTLPREGKWKIFVAADEPIVRHVLTGVSVERLEGARSARVALELPNTRITGEVVDSDNRPVVGAIVRLLHMGEFQPTSQTADEDGEFTFYGAAEGTTSLMAELPDMASEQVTVVVDEDAEAPPVRLVMQKMKQMRGRVLSASGGVPGARVLALAFPPGSPRPRPFGYQAASDVDGGFHLAVPADAGHYQVTIFPPGHTLAFLQVTPEEAEDVTVSVDAYGGKLSLDLGEPLDWTSSTAPKPFVIVDGTQLDAQTLHLWAQISGVDNSDPSRLEVPALPPGHYTACVASAAEALTGLHGPRCAEGDLSPLGELALDVRPRGHRQNPKTAAR